MREGGILSGRRNLADRLAADHRWLRALVTSTIGASPLTVIVSATPPTLRSAFTVATNLPDNSMPSRLTVVNPVQRERHGVGARPQVFNRVLTGAVRHHRACLFDERRTRRFNGDAWHHSPRASLTVPTIEACA